MRSIYHIYIAILTTIIAFPTNAMIPSRLQILTNKITALQQNLSLDKHKQNKITQQLAAIEKQINENTNHLAKIQQEQQEQQKIITEIEQQIIIYHTQIETLKQRLAQHITARYKIRETTPIQWILHAKKIEEGRQLISYYQYIIKDDRHTIDEIRQKENEIIAREQELKQQQDKQQQLALTWQKQQQTLLQQKALQEKFLQQLTNLINNTQTTLSSYEKNKQQLTHIVNNLSNNSVIQTRHSFTQMRHNLLSPLTPFKSEPQKFHQGLLFVAPEGTPVYSVYPGKVVFADWLNGYGLLVIIDHGWGFMTLYANNKTLFKHTNDFVQKHDLIAHVGHAGGLSNKGLYFEIRHYGKTIASRDWIVG
jgi:murein hydrolase activator